MMIEAFDEAGSDRKAVEEMKIWLLKQKQTQDWKTPRATAEACYALLLRGTGLAFTDAVSGSVSVMKKSTLKNFPKSRRRPGQDISACHGREARSDRTWVRSPLRNPPTGLPGVPCTGSILRTSTRSPRMRHR